MTQQREKHGPKQKLVQIHVRHVNLDLRDLLENKLKGAKCPHQ